MKKQEVNNKKSTKQGQLLLVFPDDSCSSARFLGKAISIDSYQDRRVQKIYRKILNSGKS